MQDRLPTGRTKAQQVQPGVPPIPQGAGERKGAIVSPQGRIDPDRMKGHNAPPSVEVANARQQQRGQEGQTRSGAVPGTTPVGEGKSLGPIPRRDHQNLRKTMCRDGRIAATEYKMPLISYV